MPDESIDLDPYLARIEYGDSLRPTLDTLQELHTAHASHIPFENLDVLAGTPILLDLSSLQDKLVRRRRGGYCFEQNTLFAAVLERLGFAVTKLAARVRFRVETILPRTHMLLRVEADGRPWLADVGFGGEGLLRPIEMVAEQQSTQFAWTYRLTRDGDLWVLQSRRDGIWNDLYAFTEEPQLHVDFEVANWYVSTHPTSIFRRMLTLQRPTPEGRYILRDLEWTIDRGNDIVTRTVDEAAALRLCAEKIGITDTESIRLDLPPAT